MLINCGNYFNKSSFEKVCKELEKGETVEIYVDCVGHTRNNHEQETYREELTKKYGKKLVITENKGSYSYSYIYKLNNER